MTPAQRRSLDAANAALALVLKHREERIRCWNTPADAEEQIAWERRQRRVCAEARRG